MARPSSILLIGLGEHGPAILRGLVHHTDLRDTTVTVLKTSKRSEDSSVVDALPCNIKFLYFDVRTIADSESSGIFKDFHTIIGCTGMFLPSSVQIKIVKAVLAARVQHYFPWQFGVDYDKIGPNSSQDLFTTQLSVRRILRAQNDMRWTILSTGMFTSFLFEPSFGLVDAKWETVTGIGSWDNEITVTSPSDIGRLVAELVFTQPGPAGVVYAAGDTVSMRQLADIVARVSGHEVRRQLKAKDELRKELELDPGDGMKKYRVVFAEGTGVAWDKSQTFNEKIGMTMESAAEWAAVHFPRNKRARLINDDMVTRH